MNIKILLLLLTVCFLAILGLWISLSQDAVASQLEKVDATFIAKEVSIAEFTRLQGIAEGLIDDGHRVPLQLQQSLQETIGGLTESGQLQRDVREYNLPETVIPDIMEIGWKHKGRHEYPFLIGAQYDESKGSIVVYCTGKPDDVALFYESVSARVGSDR